MKRKDKTKYLVLGALNASPKSGYDIRRWVQVVLGNFWSESSGQVYPSLQQLLSAGMVKVDCSQGAGRRLRNVYKITKKGLAMLREWLEVPALHQVARNELLLKLFFGKAVAREKNIAHIKTRQSELEAEIAELETIKQHIKKEHQGGEDALFWLLAVNHGLHSYRAELKWCEESLLLLRRLKK